MKSQKEKYIDFVSGQEELSFFYSPDWLDCVCGNKNWGASISISKGGIVEGILPFFIGKKYGFDEVSMPPFTPFLSPKIFYPNQLKKHSKYSFDKKVLTNLADQLPKVHSFRQKWNPETKNWLPFLWRGFDQQTRYSYFLKHSKSMEKCFENFSSKIRNDIKTASKNYVAKESEKIDTFLKINQHSFKSQGLTVPYSDQLFRETDDFLKLKNRRILIEAVEKNTGKIDAGVYLILDNQCAYLFATGKTSEAKRGVVTYLIWEAIQKVFNLGLDFDFEGSSIEAIERFFRGFGGEMRPYHLVYRFSKSVKLLRVISGK